MGVASKIGLWLKSIRVIKNNPKFREFLKNLGIVISKRVYPNGVTKDIGKAGKFRLSSYFVFSDFKNWGKGRNNVFTKLLGLARGRNVVLDIGAHIGLCSMPISRVLGQGGICYAFEPSEANLRYLH